MPKDTQSSPQNPNTPLPAGYVPDVEKLSMMSWKAANFTTVLVTTSTLVSAVQSPINAVIANLMKDGHFLPPAARGGILSAVRSLYVGLGSNLAGSSARTAYVTGAKKHSATIEASEHGIEEAQVHELEKSTKRTNSSSLVRGLAYTSAVALGDVLVMKVPATRELLMKFRIIEPNFHWKTPYNIFQLTRTGFISRFNGGIVNYAALCMLGDFYARYIPIDDPKGRHFVAGAASGMTAAIASYPFATYGDRLLANASVVDGRLNIPSAFGFTSTALAYVREVGMKKVATDLGKEFIRTAPLRMARTGATFAVVASVGAALGNEPLARIIEPPKPSQSGGSTLGFFAKPSPSSTTTASEAEEWYERSRTFFD